MFSSSKLGKAPWNSKPGRDPGVIIDAALRSIGYNKFMGAVGDIVGSNTWVIQEYILLEEML